MSFLETIYNHILKGMAMKKTISKKQNWFKQISLTKDDELYVGIDVHKNSYNVAFWLNDAPAIDFVMPADNQKVVNMLDNLRIAMKLVVYEAGPTGYSLARPSSLLLRRARLLQDAQLPVRVIAPSKTPRQSARESKTDRLDCRRLAQYAAKGLLRPIAIPTRQQESDRQLSRLRQQLVEKQRRVKLQIKSFLLQHGISEPAGLKSWSGAAIAQLAAMTLQQQLRYCLDALLEELSFIKAQIKKTEQRLQETFSSPQYTQKVELLLTHPGVGPVIAGQFCTEIFNPKRFDNSMELAKYVGLSPMVSQSGETQRDGPILKTGRPQLRSNLVEASWIWIRKDPYAYRVYHRILRNTGEKNKAITAMARRLAIHLWKILSENKPYVPAA